MFFMTMTSQNGALFSYRAATGEYPLHLRQPDRIDGSLLGEISPPRKCCLPASIRRMEKTGPRLARQIWRWQQAPDCGTVAVTAHNNVLTNTARFDSLSVTAQLPAAPAGLSATLSNAAASLNWFATPNAISYNVKRATTNTGLYVTIASNILGTNYTDATAVSGSTNYYVVTAVNANGESPESNQAALLVTLPQLVINFSAGGLAFSWLNATAPGFTLYSATNLMPPVAWMPVTNATLSRKGLTGL